MKLIDEINNRINNYSTPIELGNTIVEVYGIRLVAYELLAALGFALGIIELGNNVFLSCLLTFAFEKILLKVILKNFANKQRMTNIIVISLIGLVVLILGFSMLTVFTKPAEGVTLVISSSIVSAVMIFILILCLIKFKIEDRTAIENENRRALLESWWIVIPAFFIPLISGKLFASANSFLVNLLRQFF